MSRTKNAKTHHASDLIMLLVDAEWLENDLHEMELCIELGSNAAKRRYETLKERVIDELSRLKAPPSWKAQMQIVRRWKANCRKAAKNEPKTPAQPPKELNNNVYSFSGFGYELRYATDDMLVCREIGGKAAQKHYESCAKTVEHILGRKPPSWTEARSDWLEAEQNFRVLARAAKASGEAVFPPFTPEELDEK